MELWRDHGLKVVALFAAIVLAGALAGLGSGGGARSDTSTRTSAGEASDATPPAGAALGVARRPSGRVGQSASPSRPPGVRAFENQDEDGPPIRRITPTSSQRSAVKAAALAFMRGYLPYSYGQAKAAAITDVTAGERDQLSSDPPEVPAAIRRRRPHVLGVRLAPYAAGEWEATVKVSDGTLSYPVPLVLGAGPAGWEVLAIQN